MEWWYLLCADVGEWRTVEGTGGEEGERIEFTALELREKDNRVKREGERSEENVEGVERS